MEESFESYRRRVHEASFANALLEACGDAIRNALQRGMDPDYLFIDPSMISTISGWHPKEFYGMAVWVTPLPEGRKVIVAAVNPKEVE